VLLTRTGDGHTGLLNSACARGAEVNYLVSGITPAGGTVCGRGREQEPEACR
jgi:hypothetical protein